MGEQPKGFRVYIVVPPNAWAPRVWTWTPVGKKSQLASASDQGHQMLHIQGICYGSHIPYENVTSPEFLQQQAGF